MKIRNINESLGMDVEFEGSTIEEAKTAMLAAVRDCSEMQDVHDLVEGVDYEVVENPKTLSESMNMKFGVVDNAHVMNRVNLGLAAYDTLCLICAELDVDLKHISDSDFDSAAMILGDFCKSANEDTGYTVSVWFD